MIDFLVSFVQCLCLLGYVYGAWLVITHKADRGPMLGRESVSPPSWNRGDDKLIWHRHVAYDW